MQDSHINFGLRKGWGDPAPFGMSAEDRRHHVHVIGQTGSGKTTLLKNLIIQHIIAGHGVGVIDPHGDLAEELLDHIPPGRTDDVCYFNPSDFDFPIGLNLLHNVPRDQRPLVVSGIIETFKSLWRDSWGPRMEYILANSVSALLECQNTTILGINRLLTDADYRGWVMRQIKDPLLRDFWLKEYESYDARFLREAIAPIQNKVGQFLLSPVTRNILGQVRSRIDFRFMMDERRIFIANLSKGKIGHDKSNLLGSLLTTRFQLAAMSRADMPEREREDFYLFIDEFQNFSTDTFAAMLAEARKYRLCLTLSHQYLDQLSLPVRQAVLGNVGTLICFRIGASDADVMAKEFHMDFTPRQFVEMDKFQILVKLLENGMHREPFPGLTAPPIRPASSNKARLIARSRQRFASPRVEVVEKLERWMRK
jgi:hypothetical protein